MEWTLDNSQRILSLAGEHLLLSVPAIFAAFFIAVPIARAANRIRPVRNVVVSGMGLLYAVPSLPLFIVLPILLGTGMRDTVNVVVALTLFGLALMVRSAADALDAVDPNATVAATAMGYSALGRFFRVELPLGAPALLAGLRVVSVSTISLVSVSAVLGVSSLGSLFTDGFERGITASIVAGILGTALLALILDLLLMLGGRLIMPWAKVRASA